MKARDARGTDAGEPDTMTTADDRDDLLRLPGLYRQWELGQVLRTGVEHRIEAAGWSADGGALFAVYAAVPQARETDR